MIQLTIINDGTGTVEYGNYVVSVLLPKDGEFVLTEARVANFYRPAGWAALCEVAVTALEDLA